MKTNNGCFYVARNDMRIISTENKVIDVHKGDVIMADKIQNETVYFSIKKNHFEFTEKNFELYFAPSSFKHFEFDELPDDKKMSDSQDKICKVLDAMKDLLVYKNQKYGDSALHPNNVFYKGNSTNSILIRLDDKIGRIKNNNGDIRVNDVCDFIGYLTLLLVSMGVDVSEIEKLKD